MRLVVLRTVSAAASLALVFVACRGGSPQQSIAESSPQEATIVVGATEFSPASVTLQANRPARLHFQRKPDAQCTEKVVIADLGIRRPLGVNQTTTIELPAQPARTLRFACGMGMLRGDLVVQ